MLWDPSRLVGNPNRQPARLPDPKQSLSLVPRHMSATRILVLSLVCVLACPEPFEIPFCIQHLNLQLEPVCNHNLRGLSVDHLPVFEIITFLWQSHRLEGLFISVVGQRNPFHSVGSETASHVTCVFDIFLERCPSLLFR